MELRPWSMPVRLRTWDGSVAGAVDGATAPPVPALLFGLGAIGMVRQPDGLASDLSLLAHQVHRLLSREQTAPPVPARLTAGVDQAPGRTPD